MQKQSATHASGYTACHPENANEFLKNANEFFKNANEFFKNANEFFKNANEFFKKTNEFLGAVAPVALVADYCVLFISRLSQGAALG